MVDAATSRFRPTGPMIAAAAIVVLLLLLLPQPWVSWGSEVDINSGRVRESTWVVGIPIKQHVEETWVSQAAEPLGQPDWHYAVTHDWWNHVSPHYRYHTALAQMETIKLMDGLVPWDDQAQAKAAHDLLGCWQTGSDNTADEYIVRLEAMLSQKLAAPKGQRRVSVEDLTEAQLPSAS